MKKAQFLVFITLFLVACSSTPPQTIPSGEVIETKIFASHSERPVWLTDTPKDDESFSYLVGMSQKATDEQAATDNASAHAANSFVKSCGIRVSILDSYTREAKGQSTAGPIEQTVTGKSTEKQRANAFVSGLKIKTRYTEKWAVRQGGIKLGNNYFIALLFGVPKDECSRIKEWWKNYIARFVKGLYHMIKEAQSFAAKGNFESALNTMIEAENRIAENNIDPGEINYRYSMIRTLKADYQDKIINRRIDRAFQQSSGFAENGNITVAFKLLNTTKTAIVKSVSNPVKQKTYLTRVQSHEDELVTRLTLSASGKAKQRIEPGKMPEPISIRLDYKSENGKHKSVPSFPVLFESKTWQERRKTDNNGIAELTMSEAPAEGNLTIRVAIDTLELSGIVSSEVLASLSEREMLFQISIKSMLVGLGRMEKQDFLLRIWTDSGEGSYKVGDTVTINAQCGTRCYLKVFNIDDQGKVTALLDTQSNRLLKNGRKSFQVKAVSPGVQSLVAIASSKAFPLNFESNETINSNSFPVIYKKLKLSTKAKAEDRVTITIVE